jgi:uncharacterized glyoxalase superfamily protein PhnB
VIGHITHTYVWVEDHDRALDFYTRVLDFEEREDRPAGDRRWVTIGRPGQPGLRVALIAIDGLGAEEAGLARALLAAGVVVAGGLATTDCRGAYQRLVAAGVTFIAAPEDRPYGVEAVLSDDSGNRWGLVEPR